METKKCKECDNTYDLSMFSKRSGKKCIDCHKEHVKLYLIKNRDVTNKRQKEYRANLPSERKIQLLEYKKEYNKINQDDISKKRKLYREKNEDYIKQYRYEYYHSTKEQNRDILRLKSREYYYNNLEKLKAYRSKTKDRRKIYNRCYQIRNMDSIILKRIANRDKLKKYRQLNKDVIAKRNKEYWSRNRDKKNFNNSKRRAIKLKAMPKWLDSDDLNQIKTIYTESRDKSKLTGVTYNVDHIHPLQGKDFCGLHVPWNLQLLTAHENMSKNNRLLS
jgi:hypothetical protein